MVAIINETAPTASLSNEAYVDKQYTWDEATFTWDSAPGTWDHQTTVVANETAPTATLTNET